MKAKKIKTAFDINQCNDLPDCRNQAGEHGKMEAGAIIVMMERVFRSNHREHSANVISLSLRSMHSSYKNSPLT